MPDRAELGVIPLRTIRNRLLGARETLRRGGRISEAHAAVLVTDMHRLYQSHEALRRRITNARTAIDRDG